MNLLRRLHQWPSRQGDSREAVTAAAQRGSRRAFDALARAHEARLRGFITRQVGAAAADDVLQETWIAGWTALPRLTQRVNFKPWLYGIALHKCRDHHRRHAREAAAVLSIPPEYAPTAWDEGIALRETVQALLAGLPGPQREALELYYYADLTLPEIAAATGRNLNTVKYQFYRAHAQAAQHLADGEREDG